jgi:5-bromo-4-chloroindolyl phosphate hydrolysis protein
MEEEIQILWTPHKDILMSQLRSQTERLREVLHDSEQENMDTDYIKTCLKEIEINLRRIRKTCVDSSIH